MLFRHLVLHLEKLAVFKKSESFISYTLFFSTYSFFDCSLFRRNLSWNINSFLVSFSIEAFCLDTIFLPFFPPFCTLDLSEYLWSFGSERVLYAYIPSFTLLALNTLDKYNVLRHRYHFYMFHNVVLHFDFFRIFIKNSWLIYIVYSCDQASHFVFQLHLLILNYGIWQNYVKTHQHKY